MRAQDGLRERRSLLVEPDLARILLTEADLRKALDSTDLTITSDLYEMTDDSSDVSDPACLGAFYTAEEPIYQDTGYTAVRTRLARESDDYGFTVEQTGVILPSVDVAEEFVDESAQVWGHCTAVPLSRTDGSEWHDWQLLQVIRDGGIISQTSQWANNGGYQCQHSMAAAANAIVEVSVCGVRMRNEAQSMVAEIVAKVA